jgi:hypothetical protein
MLKCRYYNCFEIFKYENDRLNHELNIHIICILGDCLNNPLFFEEKTMYYKHLYNNHFIEETNLSEEKDEKFFEEKDEKFSEEDKDHYLNRLKRILGDLNDWIYAGGNRGSKLKYFNQNYEMINCKYKNYCVCGHVIIENCYIFNKKTGQLKVLGNCCIKRYLPKNNQKKTCKKCNNAHKNRLNNLCNNCRIKYLCKCGNEKELEKEKCFKCLTICKCGNKKKEVYKNCWNCYIKTIDKCNCGNNKKIKHENCWNCYNEK